MFNNTVNALKDILNIFVQILKYSGLAIFVWGLIRFAMALKDETTEPKVTAFLIMMAGLLLWGLQGIVNVLLEGTGGAI